jgi:hypothetical protein
VKTLWQELTKWLDENDKIDNLKALNYDNMWNPGMPMTQLDANLRGIYLFIVDWVEKKQKQELVNGGCEWESATKPTLEKAMKHYSWMADVSTLQKFKSVGGNLQVILICAKFVLMDDHALGCPNSFFSGHATKDQVFIPRKDIDYFYTKDFYVKSVFKNLCAASNTIGNRVMVEKHLLIILRAGEKNSLLYKDLTENWPQFSEYESKCHFEYQFPKKSNPDSQKDKRFKTLVDSNFSNPKHKPAWVAIGRKLLFCVYHSVLCDFFESASHFGLNPPLPYNLYDSKSNQKLALYMK